MVTGSRIDSSALSVVQWTTTFGVEVSGGGVPGSLLFLSRNGCMICEAPGFPSSVGIESSDLPV